MKGSRYAGNKALGYDVKCNQKKIKITPGPADYIDSDHRTTTGVGASAVNKISQNYKLNNGGLSKPSAMSDKEAFIAKAFGRSHSSRDVNKDLGKAVKGIKINQTQNTVQMSGYAPSNYAASVGSVRVKAKGGNDVNLSDDMTMAAMS